MSSPRRSRSTTLSGPHDIYTERVTLECVIRNLNPLLHHIAFGKTLSVSRPFRSAAFSSLLSQCRHNDSCAAEPSSFASDSTINSIFETDLMLGRQSTARRPSIHRSPVVEHDLLFPLRSLSGTRFYSSRRWRRRQCRRERLQRPASGLKRSGDLATLIRRPSRRRSVQPLRRTCSSALVGQPNRSAERINYC